MLYAIELIVHAYIEGKKMIEHSYCILIRLNIYMSVFKINQHKSICIL